MFELSLPTEKLYQLFTFAGIILASFCVYNIYIYSTASDENQIALNKDLQLALEEQANALAHLDNIERNTALAENSADEAGRRVQNTTSKEALLRELELVQELKEESKSLASQTQAARNQVSDLRDCFNLHFLSI